LGAGDASMLKNRIINGAMVIDKRNSCASVTLTQTSGNQYTLDRFGWGLTQASKLTTQQNQGSVTPPAGFQNYLGATSSSAYTLVSGDVFAVFQRIEQYNLSDLAWGTANAKPITLSFWAYSSLTGTFGGAINNSPATRSYPFTYTISTANTWTYITITIPGDTSSTWSTGNGVNNQTGMQVNLSYGTGSTYSGTAGAWASASYYGATGANSVVSTNGATLYFTGVQLEVGSSATGFEYRQYQQELALCQRYYQKWVSTNGSYLSIGNGICSSAGTMNRWGFPLGISLRTSPTINLYNCVGWDGAVGGAATVSVNYSSTNNIDIDITSSGLTTGAGHACKLLINGAAGGYMETTGTEL
jgi:hypothetical protein